MESQPLTIRVAPEVAQDYVEGQTEAVSDILRAIKSDSSGWVHRERPGD